MFFPRIFHLGRHCRQTLLIGGIALGFVPGVSAATYPDSALQDIPIDHVKVDDPFWSERIRTVQEVTMPDLLDLAQEEGKLDNFRIVAGRKAGKIRLHNAPDSDVYKLIQDAAYTLAWRRHPVLEKRLDALIEDIAAAQRPDGYLNTQYSLPFANPTSPPESDPHVQKFGYGPDWIWKSDMQGWPKGYSQTYCAGHLMEAGAAYYQATGKRTLLDVAIRNANHIAGVFTLEKIKSYADHPEVSIGLMKLYEVTGDAHYLELANNFCRYLTFARPVDLGHGQDTHPLAEQTHAYGHCVRAAYIYAGATDVVRATGAGDLRAALDALWRDVTGHKMYVDGGTGNGAASEQLGEDDNLPIKATYSETCAAVAQGQWNQRLNLLTGDARYVDVVELETWNNALAGISLDGTKYSYSNKLNLDATDRHDFHTGIRARDLFCCSSKVPGFIAGIGRWIYAANADSLVVNLFVGSELHTTLAGQPLTVKQVSELPWTGRDEIILKKCPARKFAVRVRLPAWAAGDVAFRGGPYHFGPGEKPAWKFKLNGEELNIQPDAQGYLTLRRVWHAGDKLEFTSSMPVRRVYTDERIAANRGRVALMRGPVLYSLEGLDNSFDVLQMALPSTAKITTEPQPGLLGGVTVLHGEGEMPDGKTVQFTAIPYYAWENRGVSGLATLLIENRSLIVPDKKAPKKKVNADG